jgi:hypothetical protein
MMNYKLRIFAHTLTLIALAPAILTLLQYCSRVTSFCGAGVLFMVTLVAMLGHSRIEMVLRYAHPNEEHQFAAMEKRQRYMLK